MAWSMRPGLELRANSNSSGRLGAVPPNQIDILDDQQSRLQKSGKLHVLSPLLDRAAETGAIGWSALRLVLRRATSEDEALWLRLAQTVSIRWLEKLVREAGEEDGSGETIRIKLELYLSLQGSALFQTATRALCEREGRRIAPGDIFEWILADWISGLLGESRETVMEEARRDLETPWAAVDVVETPCPGNPEVTLVCQPHWTKNIRFNPDSRHVTDAQRKLLLRRDGYRCATPGCPNILWLHMHHIVFYCEGGATVPTNLLTCCSSCHANIHKGFLRVRGQAPEDLSWQDSQGRELGRPELADPPRASDWFDTG